MFLDAATILTSKALATTSSDTPNTSTGDFSGPTAKSLNQLASSLTQWRGMLPKEIQWAEDDPAAFPTPQGNAGDCSQPLDPNLNQQALPGQPLFSTDLDSEPVHYPYAYEIQVALLRSRYYYAKHMVYRPFIYKALHFPEQMTQDDAQGVAECLRVSSRFLRVWYLLQPVDMAIAIDTRISLYY